MRELWQRQIWLSLARNREAPSEQAVREDESRMRSSDENRILGRLIELLPDKIDLYNFMLWEAQNASLEKAKLVMRLGRGRVEPLLEEAIAQFRSSGQFDNVDGVARIPRNLYDLVEAKLLRRKS
jgi:hypothetical protein